MREKSTSQKKPSNDTKKKSISKQDNPKPKFLKYKPSKRDQSKQWVIQAILNQRITLVPLTEPSTEQNNHPYQKQKSEPITNIFKNYQKIKEYEIAWAQNRKQGLWPNTWQPQQNIPQGTRLDYLLKKRNKMNQKKNKRTSHFKTKQSLQKHIQFTMNKQQIGRRAATLQQRRNQSQKTIKKVLNEKSPRKNIKSHDYKNWFYSYSSKTEEYEKMIHRFLKQQKNANLKKNQLTNSKPQKIQNLKAEFIESVQILKEENNDDGVSQLLQKQEKSPNKAQNAKDDELKADHIPKKTCLKLVKDIAYLGEVDNAHRFILKYYDDSLKFIREDDLIKYLPWIYEKLMIRTIENELQDCAEKLASINPDNSFHSGRHLEELSYEVGLSRNYFWQLQKEQKRRKHRYFTSQNDHSNKNFNDFSFFHDHQVSSGKQKPQANPFQDKDFDQITNEIEQLHIEKINQIEKCFNFLSQKFPQDDTLLNQQQVKKKITDDYKLANCKYLFPSNSNLIDQWKSTKSNQQSQKLSNVKKEMRQSSIKIENSFESKQSKQSKSNRQEKSDKKPKLTLKIQSHEHLPNDKNKGEPSKKETTEIKENSNIHQKKPQKKVKLTEEEEMNQILGQMEETPTNRKKDDLYDSEEEQSKN